MSLKILNFTICFLLMTALVTQANDMRNAPPEVIDAIMIGDRVVDIAYNLQVLPKAMVVRGSEWPMAAKLKTASQILGCPTRVTVINKETVPEALKRYGVKRLIVEKNDAFCLYKPEVKPENIVPILEGMDVKIDFVDFADGLESAISQTGKILGQEKQAEELIMRYQKRAAEMSKYMSADPVNKKVVIINGVLQKVTGKSFLRVEAPEGYSDKFLLEPLGCTNIGEQLIDKAKVNKGHVTIRSLAGLADLRPDAIVITGDSAGVQRAIHDEVEKNRAFADIPALKKHAVFSLPRYIDSSVIEYPLIFIQWAKALSDKNR